MQSTNRYLPNHFPESLVSAEPRDVRYTVIRPETSQSDLSGDDVYFAVHNGPYSYSIYLERADAMKEWEIREFIRSRSPKIFAKTFRPHPAPISNMARFILPSSLTNILVEGEGQKCNAGIEEGRPLLKQDGDPMRRYGHDMSSSDVGIAERGDQLSQLRHFIVQAILGECLRRAIRMADLSTTGASQFVLQKSSLLNPVLHCSYPFCPYHRTQIPPAVYLLSLISSLDPIYCPGDPPLASALFCLPCIENLFDEPDEYDTATKSVLPSFLADGACGGDVVFRAAQRLMPQTPTPLPKVGLKYGTLPFLYPSNSPQALHCRLLRDREIEEILDDIKRAQDGEEFRLDDGSPTLVILPRTDVPTYRSRYRKQGRTLYDKKKEVHEHRHASEEQSKNEDSKYWKLSLGSPVELMCYCREPANGTPLVVCSSEMCPIGGFHFSCSGLKEPLQNGQIWYCTNCSPVLDTSQVSLGTTDVYISSENEGSEQSAGVEVLRGECEDEEEEYLLSNSQIETDEVALNLKTQCAQGDVEQFDIHPVSVGTEPILFDGTKLPPSGSKATAKISGADFASQTMHKHLRFADLAPFITIEVHPTISSLATQIPAQHTGLAQQHLAVLEQWKSLCPHSQLLSRATPGQLPPPGYSHPIPQSTASTGANEVPNARAHGFIAINMDPNNANVSNQRSAQILEDNGSGPLIHQDPPSQYPQPRPLHHGRLIGLCEPSQSEGHECDPERDQQREKNRTAAKSRSVPKLSTMLAEVDRELGTQSPKIKCSRKEMTVGRSGRGGPPLIAQKDFS